MALCVPAVDFILRESVVKDVTVIKGMLELFNSQQVNGTLTWLLVILSSPNIVIPDIDEDIYLHPYYQTSFNKRRSYSHRDKWPLDGWNSIAWYLERHVFSSSNRYLPRTPFFEEFWQRLATCFCNFCKLQSKYAIFMESSPQSEF